MLCRNCGRSTIVVKYEEKVIQIKCPSCGHSDEIVCSSCTDIDIPKAQDLMEEPSYSSLSEGSVLKENSIEKTTTSDNCCHDDCFDEKSNSDEDEEEEMKQHRKGLIEGVAIGCVLGITAWLTASYFNNSQVKEDFKCSTFDNSVNIDEKGRTTALNQNSNTAQNIQTGNEMAVLDSNDADQTGNIKTDIIKKDSKDKVLNSNHEDRTGNGEADVLKESKGKDVDSNHEKRTGNGEAVVLKESKGKDVDSNHKEKAGNGEAVVLKESKGKDVDSNHKEKTGNEGADAQENIMGNDSEKSKVDNGTTAKAETTGKNNKKKK